MMRDMRQGTAGVSGACLLGIFLVCGCGGGKGANSPGECPEGTALQGSDCIPADAANEDQAPKRKPARKSDDGEATSSAGDVVACNIERSVGSKPSA